MISSILAVLFMPVMQEPPRSVIEPVDLELVREGGLEMLRGVHRVPEDRATGRGRTLGLDIVVLPALGDDPAPDPIFFLAGGPGQRATDLVSMIAARYPGLRQRRALVFVDQRGTGGDHRLACDFDSGDLQSRLNPMFRAEDVAACARELSASADLRLYTTPIAMDDLDEVRRALGYEKINLMGGSYGTRACLVYLRRHEPTVRSVVLNGVAPIAFRNPLYHAREAQMALDGLLKRCAEDPACSEAFPDSAGDLAKILAVLDEKPATVTIAQGGEKHALVLTRAAFAESLRGMLYSSSTASRIPLLLHRGASGDLSPFVQFALQRNAALRSMLALGMLLSVTCPEDVARINPDEIEALTKDTFLGDGRVRQQIEACASWPSGSVGESYGQPVRSDVPVLILSGRCDPVTSPTFGEEAAKHLPSSRHVVVEGAHFVGGACIDDLIRQFLETADAKGLDVDCAKRVTLPAFEVK
ncbi:MAG: alpha/beta hydrolase [Planctomycetota bacterium]